VESNVFLSKPEQHGGRKCICSST